jgi:GTPase
MFTLNNPTKVDSGYVVTSHPCPICKAAASVKIDSAKLFAYHQGAYAQEVLSEFDASVRERFISGLCESCW